MTRLSEQPAKQMRPVLRVGEQLAAAVQFEYPKGGPGANARLARLASSLGFDPSADLSYEKRAIYGYLAVTDCRLIIAKSPVLSNVNERHVFAEAPVDECRLAWYDTKDLGFDLRAILFALPGGRFASGIVRMTWPGGQGQADAIRALADGLVDAFGERATRVEPLG